MNLKLFNEPSEGKIAVEDSKGNKKEIEIKELQLRVGVYGVLKKDNEILLTWNPLIDSYSFPGGGIELGEKINTALEREFEEETGLRVIIKKLIDIKESMFMYKDEYAHSIMIFYEVEVVGGEIIPQGNAEDSSEVRYIDKMDILKDDFRMSSQYKEIVEVS